MTIQEILRKEYSKYKLSPLDAKIILSLVLRKPKEYILAHSEKELTKSEYQKYVLFAKRRFAGEPIAYIVEKKEFFGLDFAVDKNVLIPRPETELIVELVLKKIKNTKRKIPDTIMDIGTGSGNIIISIIRNLSKKNRNRVNLIAVDISKDALKVAKENAYNHKVEKKIKFIRSNLLKYFLKNKNNISKNLFITANLPYVSPALYQKNKKNLKYEPKNALISGRKGLAHYISLIREIGSLQKTNKAINIFGLLEISPEQKPEISRILKKYLSKARVRFFKDLAGKWRVMKIEI